MSPSIKQLEAEQIASRPRREVEGVFGTRRRTSPQESREDPLRKVGLPTGLSVSFRENAHMPRTLLGGTKSMRDAGTVYLPQHPAEQSSQYTTRLNKTFLFNAFERAIQMLVGKPFGPGRGVVPNEDVPPAMEPWLEDIDLEGRDISTFAENWLEESLATGMTVALADYPRVPAGVSLFEERQVLKARPYATLIPGDRILGWEAERIAGEMQIVSLRYEETRWRQGPTPYEQEQQERVRILHMGNPAVTDPSIMQYWAWFEVFQKINGKWQGPVDMGPMVPFRKIPAVVHYTGRTSFLHARPPLDDLGWKNVEHWQSTSEQRNNLFVARVPVLHGAGFDADEKKARKVIGAFVGWFTSAADSKLSYVRGSAEPLEPGFKDLRLLEEHMATLSLQPLIERAPGRETATGKLIDSTIGDSRLQAWVRGLSSSLSQLLDLLAIYGDLGTDGGSVTMETDFGIGPQEVRDLKEIIQIRQLGEISRETFYELLKDRNVLPEDFDRAQEVLRLQREEEGTELDDSDLDEEPQEEPDEEEKGAEDGGAEA